jgi:hypothetical protein
MSNLFLATNELKDAVFSLRMVAECLAKVKEESHYWKWIIIALHSSLQGFMVSALCQGNQFPIMESARPKVFKCPHCLLETELPDQRDWGSLEEWRRFHFGPPRDHGNKKVPKAPRLVSFRTLYKRIKDRHYMQRLSGSKAFRPQGTQGMSVKRLIVEKRNAFVHFTPKFSLSICQDYLPVVKDVIAVISFLAFESGNILWPGPEDPDDLRSQTERLVTDVGAMTDELDKYYTAESKKKPPPDPELDELMEAIWQRMESSEED